MRRREADEMRDDVERAGCDRRSRCPKDVLLPAAEKGAVGWEKVKSGFKQLGDDVDDKNSHRRA